MNKRQRVVVRRGRLLWQLDNVICTCLTKEPGHLQVVVTVAGEVVQKGWFSTHAAAAEFAVDALRRCRAV